MTKIGTLQDLVRNVASRGSRMAILSFAEDGSATSLSYADLADSALKLARGMLAAGVRPGDPVILFGPNSAAWITVRLALGAMGAVAVALDDLSTDAELAVLIPDSEARVIFAAAAHIERLKALPDAGARTIYTLDDSPDGSMASWRSLLSDSASELPEIAPHADCMLVFTSGTTGAPKSFMLTHANLAANMNGLCAERLVDTDDRVLLPLPLHHVYPLTVGCLTALACGTTIVLPAGVTGPQIASALQRGRVTVIVGVPRLYAALAAALEARVAARGKLAHAAFKALLAVSMAARRHLGWRIGRVLFAPLHRQLAPDLWLMASGGARLEPDLIWKLEALGWEVLSGYGLAETSSILTANRRGRARIGSEGTPLPGAELRIAAAGPDGIGEIEARGASVFAGYRRNAEANEAAFTPDGWFRTGDLGTIDRDGYVYITGRVKETIVLGGGKNVFPEELEKVYAESPYLREVAVLERAGALVALVVPDLEAIGATGSRRIEDVVRVALAERSRLLPSYQRIAGFAVVRDPLPRTRLGKYQRFLLPELYEQAKAGIAAPRGFEQTPADRELLSTSPAREIWAWLAARYPARNLSPDLSPQLDLGIDSLEWVTMTLELSQRFGVHLTEQDAADSQTLRDLLQRANARAREGHQPETHTSKLDSEQRAWIEPPGMAGRIAGLVLHAINTAVMHGVFRLRTSGLEHLPLHGPYVVVCNHLSDLDPFVVAAALGHRRLKRVWWGGDVGRLFENAAGRAFAHAAHVFPVDERAPATALALGEAVLRRGDALVWFPESWRSPDGELQEFRVGIGHLLARVAVPAIPARITGTFEAMPRGRRVPRPVRLSIAFGSPLDSAAISSGAAASDTPRRISSILHDAVAALPRETDRS